VVVIVLIICSGGAVVRWIISHRIFCRYGLDKCSTVVYSVYVGTIPAQLEGATQ